MQKGFASFEVILAALIIALLATVAVPNAATLVDKAALHYEQKRLYSELEFVRTRNRTATVSSEGMNITDFFSSRITVAKRVELELHRGTNSYQVMRDDKPVREPHYLSYGVTISDETNVPQKVWFDTTGSTNPEFKSKSIVLKSRRGAKSTIVFNSVGRIRGGK